MTLREVLLTDEKRAATVDACEALVKNEVALKSGLSGLAIKAGFKAVVAFKKTIIHDACDALVDEFVDVLEDYYAQHLAREGEDLKDAMVRDADSVAEILLKVTDNRAKKNKSKVLVGAYNKLRPLGKSQVVTAMPRLADMLKEQGA